MSYQADNAVILAAGLSSRFAPISYEMPKALIPVRGEILIERQIRQLREAGIDQVIVVTGYKAEMFEYLKKSWVLFWSITRSITRRIITAPSMQSGNI